MFNQNSNIYTVYKNELNFSKYANVYDKNAQLQKKMAKNLSSFIPNIISGKILEIGCGTGIFTKYLLSKSTKKIFLNDISHEMTKRMEFNLNLPPYSQIIIGNAEILKFKMVEIIAANAVFQWFKDPRYALKRFYSCSKPKGRLIFSTFGSSSLDDFRENFRIESPALLLSHSEWTEIIEDAGFTLCSSKIDSHKTFYPNTLSLLKNLQQIGASPTRMTGTGELRQLINKYDHMHSTKKGICANWELLYFSAINNQ